MENQRFCGFRTLREQQLVTKQVYIDPINWCPAQLLIFMKKPITIYLADLVYDTVRTNHVVPLNVAYIAAYAKEYFADKVHIEIFKYPTELEKKLKEKWGQITVF